MSDISIQFHALPAELLNLIQQWVDHYALHVTRVESGPFQLTKLRSPNVACLPPIRGTVRLALTASEPNLSATSDGVFADQNPDRLTIDLGAPSEKGLRESWFTTRAKDTYAVRIWKSLATELKRQTIAGAVAIHPLTGAKSVLRSHRYTQGAAQFWKNGGIILPAAGVTILRLENDTESNNRSKVRRSAI